MNQTTSGNLPADLSGFLESRGFYLAKKGFPSYGGRVLHSLMDYGINGFSSRQGSLPDAKRYLLNCETGMWQRWGQQWREWERGPWHELAEEDPPELPPAAAAEPARKPATPQPARRVKPDPQPCHLSQVGVMVEHSGARKQTSLFT